MAREIWHLDKAGRRHEVELSDAGLGRRVVWTVDGTVVAEKKSHDERLQLKSDREGAVFVKLPKLIGPARRVTWLEEPAELAEIGLAAGGVDFRPEPGSRAARREQRIVDHPRLHTLRETAGAALGVILPLVLVWLVGRFVFSFDLPWPDVDLPDIPWPDIDLPGIPWPDVDLPAIPWPDITLPAWLKWVLQNVKYVAPVLVAFVVARGEVRRRRKQEESRSRGAARSTDENDA